MKFNRVFKQVTVAAVLGVAAIAGASQVSKADSIYTVKPGDTLSSISMQLQNDLGLVNDSFASSNHLQSVDMIFPGQKLVIKANGTVAPATKAQVQADPAATTTTTNNNTNAAAPVAAQPAQQPAATTTPAAKTTTNVATQPAATTTPAAKTTTPSAPVTPAKTQQAPVTTTKQTVSYQAPKTQTPKPASYSYQAPAKPAAAPVASNGSDASAKAYIAGRESGGSYTARNGQYIGKYQLSSSYLNGDYSAANQERVANQYAISRYGSWANAQHQWQANGWW